MKYLIYTLFTICSFVQLGHAQVTFNMSVNTQSSNNQFTYVDVTVEDFNDIVSFQFAMLWDPSIFKVEAVTNYNSDLVGFGEVTTTLPDETPAADDGTVRMIWFDPVTAANSLADGSLLFTIKFSHVGNACQSSDLAFGDALPTLVEIIDQNLNQVNLVSSPITLTIPGSGCGGASGCYQSIVVNPAPFNCEVNLTEEQLLIGSGYKNVVISPDKLDASAVGQATDVSVSYELNGISDNCSVSVLFEDNIAPVAIVQSDITVSLSTDSSTTPTARVLAEEVDEGSYDNCSAVTLSPPFFDFDCSDIGTQNIFLEVTDASGNTNVAFTTVTIEYENTNPVNIICPQDVIVDCTVDINDPQELENTLGLAMGSSGCTPVYSDVFDYDFNNDGDINDTFTLNGEVFNERFSIGCNNGPLVRTWSVPGTTTKCEQLIVLREGVDFDGLTMIDWPYSLDLFASIADNDGASGCASIALDPSDIEIDVQSFPPYVEVQLSCNDDLCEVPAFDESNLCSLLGTSVESDTFFFEPGACQRIRKTYTVIDWCNYDPASGSTGIWTWTVNGIYNDIVAPQVFAFDTIVECNAALSVSALATNLRDPNDAASGCPSDQLSWNVYLDINDDGQYEREWSSFVDEDLDTPGDPLWSEDNLNDNLAVYGYSIPDVRVGNRGNVDNANAATVAVGKEYAINIPENLIDDSNTQHRIVWKAYDYCGNVTSVTSYFSVDRTSDNIAPTPKCLNFVTVKLEDPDGNGPEEPQMDVWAIDFDAGSFDNCSPKSALRFSFTDTNPDSDPDFVQGSKSAKLTFTESDLQGASFKDFGLDINVWDENDNKDICTVNLRVTNESSGCQITNISCSDFQVSLSPVGTAELNIEDLSISFNNPCNLTNIERSFSAVSPDQKIISLNCSNKGNSLNDVFIYVNGVLSGQCKVLLKVEDPSNACPGTTNEVTLKYGNYTGEQGTEICIELKADNFEDIDGVQGTLEWDPTILSYKRTQNYALNQMSEANFGENQVGNGLLTYLWYDVSASNPATIPNGGAIFEVCFDITGEEGESTSLKHVDVPTIMQVTSNAKELPLNTIDGLFTVGVSDCGPGQDKESPTPYCLNLSTAIIEAPNTEVDVWAIDIDVASFDNCTEAENLRFTFSDTNPTADPNYNSQRRSSFVSISIDDVDPDTDYVKLPVHVWDEADNNDFCLVNIKVVESDDPCYSNTEDNIQWPIPLIELNDPDIVANNWTPEILVSDYNYTEEQVFPTFVDSPCLDGFFATYSDVVINISGNSYKVVRSWTVLDWYTANTYQFEQILRINLESSLICDTLPNTAPVGDCASGHTLEDDVEWPADIAIADHRILPDELEVFSGVPSKDSRPIFYNADAALYTAEYIDILVSLSTTTLVLDRKWTVGRSDNPTLSWQYIQQITVDITMFSNLVTVNTISNRPMPNVQLNDQTTTDITGSAMVMPSDEVNPRYSDMLLNGLDLRDIIYIQRQILVQQTLNDFQLNAADMNDDQIISTFDIVELAKILTGQEQNQNTDWQFIDYTNNTGFVAQIRGHYIGYKRGDIDDSAILDGQIPTYPMQDLSFEDALLNAGESYNVPFVITDELAGFGFHVNFEIDTDVISVEEITSDYFDNIYWYVDPSSNKLSVLVYDNNSSVVSVNEYTSLFNIEFKALSNSILGTSLIFDENRISYFINGDDALIQFNGELEGGITLNTYDLGDDISVKVYPNPATDFIKFDFNGSSTMNGFQIQILDLNGQLIMSSNNSYVIDLSNLTNGVYLFQIQYGDKSFTERFIKM